MPPMLRMLEVAAARVELSPRLKVPDADRRAAEEAAADAGALDPWIRIVGSSSGPHG